MNNNNKKNLYRFLLVAAKSRNKLQDIARVCDLPRISLSEFIRSGYLGRDKFEKLKDWIIANNYLPNNINEQEYYKLLQFFLLESINSLSNISSCNPINYIKENEKPHIKDLPSSKEFLKMEKPIGFKQFKILYECIHKSFQNIGIQDEKKILDDIGKFIISQDDLFKLTVQNYIEYIIYTFKSNSIEEKFVSSNFTNNFNNFQFQKSKNAQPNEKELGIKFSRQKKYIDEKITELNKSTPPIIGPIVSCDYFCEKCKKWSPATGKFCMHCAMKINIERLSEESFKIKEFESLPN